MLLGGPEVTPLGEGVEWGGGVTVPDRISCAACHDRRRGHVMRPAGPHNVRRTDLGVGAAHVLRKLASLPSRSSPSPPPTTAAGDSGPQITSS